MLKILKSHDRGLGDHGWLKSRHTFSFANYYDPERMGFRTLRVINEDNIKGGTGFGSHSHRDMEIISYVISGALEHKDSMGNAAIIKPGEVQRMTAGTGVVHSEYNKLRDQDAHFFQIWIVPRKLGDQPGYGQKSFEAEIASGALTLVVSQSGRHGSISINQDVDLYIARPKAGTNLTFKPSAGRGVWIQVVRGRLSVNGEPVEAGDAVSTEDADPLAIESQGDSEFLLFDLA